MINTNYYPQIDIIKAFAIISVIILHTIPLDMRLSLIEILTIYQAVPIFLILMGRNVGSSFQRKEYTNLAQIFTKDYYKSRFIRLGIPFLITFLLSIIIGVIIKFKLYFGVASFIGLLPLYGPGNYYISLLFQFVFIFPFIYLLYIKNSKLTIILGILVSFIFELIAPKLLIFQNYPYLYVSCILRYFLIIILGLWLMENFNKKKALNVYIILGLIIALIYTILFCMGFKIQVFVTSWQPQNFLTFVYPLLICFIGMKYLPSKSKNVIINFIETIGKSSYHIFLIQIIIFGAGLNFPLDEYSPMNLLLTIFINVLFITTIGLIFFKLESKLTKYIVKKFSSKI